MQKERLNLSRTNGQSYLQYVLFFSVIKPQMRRFGFTFQLRKKKEKKVYFSTFYIHLIKMKLVIVLFIIMESITIFSFLSLVFASLLKKSPVLYHLVFD